MALSLVTIRNRSIWYAVCLPYDPFKTHNSSQPQILSDLPSPHLLYPLTCGSVQPTCQVDKGCSNYTTQLQYIHTRVPLPMKPTFPSVWHRLHARLCGLDECEAGGVQSLALVLTLPFFVGTILLLVQLSQVLIGVMTVQYAAFAAARAAVVWIPSWVEDQDPTRGNDVTGENEIDVYIPRGQPIDLTPGIAQHSRKFREIQAAAVQACVSISPARMVNGPRAGAGEVGDAVDAFLAFQQLTNDPRIARWRTAASNRWSYSAANTRVRLAFLGEPRLTPTYNPVGHPVVPHEGNEAGWDEAVTAIVAHEVSLVPGPGRWLFQRAAWGRVQGGLAANWPGASGRLDRVPVVGSATLTLAGLQSNRPVVYPWREE